MAAPGNDNDPAAPKPEAGEVSGKEATGKACPICGKPGLMRYRPFCSKRCADIDLNRWLGGVYAIPAREDESEGDDGGGEGSERR
jgi:endogenous inhibitor of DNA gyrase (YacG/DUF329 family)